MERHLAGQGKQPLLTVSHDLHHMVGEFALKQFQERADLPAAPPLDRGPFLARQGLDADLDIVEFRSGNLGLDLALGDGQVADRAIADVGAAAGQAVLESLNDSRCSHQASPQKLLAILRPSIVTGWMSTPFFRKASIFFMAFRRPFGHGDVRLPNRHIHRHSHIRAIPCKPSLNVCANSLERNLFRCETD